MRSVVIATYQGERFIGQQLASILPQLAPGDEVIVSDDASSDHTLDVVAKFDDARLQAFPHPDRVGYVANFERAILRSTGEQVYFADQDDVWLPNKVAALSAALLEHPCVASDAIVVDERLETLHGSYFEWRRAKSFSPLALYLKPPIVGATLACRREYLQTLLPFPAGVHHDFWITFNAAWDGRLAVVPEPLVLYRRHAGAVSESATSRRRSPLAIAAERVLLAKSMLARRLMSGPRVTGSGSSGTARVNQYETSRARRAKSRTPQ